MNTERIFPESVPEQVREWVLDWEPGDDAMSLSLLRLLWPIAHESVVRMAERAGMDPDQFRFIPAYVDDGHRIVLRTLSPSPSAQVADEVVLDDGTVSCCQDDDDPDGDGTGMAQSR